MIYTVNEQNDFKKSEKLFEQFSAPVSHSKHTNVEFMKKNGDTVFGIVKEFGQYVVKSTNKKSAKLFAEDFNYLEGYENRKKQQRKTLQEAIKYLHLIINEDKYVLDVPAPAPPPQPAPPMPVDSTPDAPIEPDGSQDAELDSGAEGDEPAKSDDEKEIQQLTGTLAQDLRTQIDDDNEKFTVGMFKSIIAAAKNLSPESKNEVMNKAEEVLNADENADQSQSPDVPTDNQNPQPDPMNQQPPVQESVNEGKKSKKEEFLDSITNLSVDRNSIEPREMINKLGGVFGDLPMCYDYKDFADQKHGAIRFMTTGKYDAVVIYWATVDRENFDVYIVDQKHVEHFLDDIYSPENRAKYVRNKMLDANYEEITTPLKQFLSSQEKVDKGTFSITKESVTMTKKELFESLGIKKSE